MEEFVRGDVVVVPFPFSDLSSVKKRPALVLFVLSGDDIVLCQVTSKDKGDKLAIELGIDDFLERGLTRASYIRPGRIFTVEKSIIQYKAGSIKKEKSDQVKDLIVSLLNG
ncbi:MAG: type II toxin-antitoxin system PemK/MazF family toxin [Flammeovirgaceae bacterium]|jgi:mRNA interferase MazF|nr:type II toxin-antitoxin system PemK/MazF family toxin [Flammeovirgaceae bacterium]